MNRRGGEIQEGEQRRVWSLLGAPGERVVAVFGFLPQVGSAPIKKSIARHRLEDWVSRELTSAPGALASLWCWGYGCRLSLLKKEKKTQEGKQKVGAFASIFVMVWFVKTSFPALDY